MDTQIGTLIQVSGESHRG